METKPYDLLVKEFRIMFKINNPIYQVLLNITKEKHCLYTMQFAFKM